MQRIFRCGLLIGLLAAAMPAAAIEIEMVNIPGGTFEMGSRHGGSDELPVHRVQIAPFKIGKYEVTQAQWRAVMGNNPSHFKGARLPAEHMTWDQVQLFLKQLNAKTGQHYRLPSEAEWEYAARAGTQGAYSWGDDLSLVRRFAWFDANSGGRTHPVGRKQPNGFGLYDMHGNVWEWTTDCYNESYDGAPDDGSPWLTGICRQRVLRGGSWRYDGYFLRSALRIWDARFARSHNAGFRLVLE